MYLALSYDHRMVDGRESVSFLFHIKELIESPLNLIYGSNDPEKLLLDI
jgi:2-oxoglutarate dehydrogenase E2 component (dihydrolipoamide succinyltransferase)